MREKYGDKIKDLEGNDPWTFIDFCIMSGSHWFFACFFAIYVGDAYSYVPLVLLGWLFGGFWACSAGLAIHEASHQLVFTGRWGAFIAGVVAEMPLFLPAYRTFLHYHMPHHFYISIDLGEENKKEMQR